jgi:hypothetical protein
MKERQDKKKNNKQNLEQERLRNYSMQDLSNKWKNKKCLRNKPELKKHSFNLPFVNKDKFDNSNKNCKKKEKNFSRSMPYS